MALGQGADHLVSSCWSHAGGLFGSSTFSQPVTSSTSTGFGFGAASGTSNSLFGSTNTGGGGLFSQQSNAFGTNKPASFGSEYPVFYRYETQRKVLIKVKSHLVTV